MNTAYAADMGKAPKVTVKNTLHEQGSMDEQTVKMAVNVTMDPHEPDRAVKVEVDWSARTDKNEAALNEFAKVIQSNIIHPDADGNITLCFWENSNQGDNIVNLTPGSYKLKVTVGRGPAENFTADTLPATVTVKVVKNKAATFKLDTTYKISKLDGGATLTGKSNLNAKAGEKMETEFYGLKNANVNGKSNNFTKYFKVEEDSTSGTWRLVMTEELKDKLASENKEMTDLDKNDLIGYITYTASPNVSYYDTSKLVATEVKITVKPVKSKK